MMVSGQDVANWMLKEVGVTERTGNNDVKYNDIYYGTPVKGSAYAWCQAMIWCCFKDLNILNLYGTKSAYTVFVASAFNQQGRFHSVNTTPQVGDMVFFDWNGGKSISGIDHVGIVIGTEGNYVITVEGNVSNRVQKIKRAKTFIVGYARPAYGSSGSTGSATGTPNDKNDKTYTVKAGDSLWAISRANSISVDEIKRLNNLSSDTIFIGQVLKLSDSDGLGSSSTIVNGGSSTIKLVQSWLNQYAFNNISIDGVYGPATKKANIKAIQYEINLQYNKNLVVDGVWGVNTRNAWPTVKSGAQGNITRTIQAFLNCKGYSTNGFDGIFGNGTLNSVQSFQRACGITVDGQVGKDTIERLVS